MAPVTPSPFRFAGAGGQRRQRSPSGDQGGLTVNKSTFSRQDQHDPRPDPAPATASQFAPTPRFSSSRLLPQSDQARAVSSFKSNFAQALHGSHRSLEDVEEARQSQEDDDDDDDGDHSDDEMLDNEQSAVLHVVDEQDVASSGSISDLPYSPKRRKLDEHPAPEPGLISTQAFARRGPPHAPLPASHLTLNTPQFTHPTSTIESVIDRSSSFHRPAFLRSSTLPAAVDRQPLPEVFSPHRRSQKFVPGGMAATMQQWIVETGQAAVQGRRRDESSVREDGAMQVRVREVNKSSKPLIIRGSLNDGTEVRVVLTGEAHNNSTQAITSRDGAIGALVAIRAPIVDVDLEDGRWYIGVDWRILS